MSKMIYRIDGDEGYLREARHYCLSYWPGVMKALGRVREVINDFILFIGGGFQTHFVKEKKYWI